MSIVGIVAVDRNGAIGKGGRLPWHYSADLKFFKRTTTGHTVVMGHRTWLTMQKPLPNRLNIVLSRNSEIASQPSLVVRRDVESVLAGARAPSHLSSSARKIYEAFLPFIDRGLSPRAPDIEDADTFMPPNTWMDLTV